MRPKNLFCAFLITVIQLSGCYLIFGCWLEEFDAVFHNFFAGIYTQPPLEMVNIDVYVGIIPFLCKLADATYPYPVNAYLFYAVTAFSCYIINYFSIKLLENVRSSKISFITTFIIFSFLAIPQFVVLLNCARTSVLLCIAAFFAATGCFTEKRNTTGCLILVVLLLATGTIVRMFTAFLATGLLIVLSFFLWRFNFFKSRFGWVFLIFFFIQAGLIGWLLNHRAHSSQLGERYVMNYEYAITNRSDLFPLANGSSPRDSLRYELMRNWLVTDTAALSESFLRKHIRHITISDIACDWNYFAEQSAMAFITLLRFAKEYLYEILIIIGLIILLPFRKKIQGVVWVVMITAMLVMLTVIGSMYDRGFAPFICLLIFGLWLLWAHQLVFEGRNIQYLFLLFALFTSFFSISHLLEIKKENLLWHNAARQFSQNALKASSLHPVVMQSADMVMFSKKAFEKFPPRDKGSIVMLNAGHISFFKFFNQPYRDRYNLDITNGKSVANFIRSQKEKGVVFVTTNDKIRLFKDYLYTFYGLDIEVEKSDVSPIESPQHTLHFFIVKRTEGT